MALRYEPIRRSLLRGDVEVTIRPMRREDIPALRRFDNELSATLDEVNAQKPPGGGISIPGGPWSNDQWLAEHFDKYEERGYLTHLAEDDAGRIVGFADLWVADEPEPFGRSLNVECIDYFREYYLMGIEAVLLEEAETVARAAGLPALDIGTNTSSGDYVSLRRFGLKVFHEYDHVLCRCRPMASRGRPETRPLTPQSADLTGLIKVSHWCPTDFTFRDDEERTSITEMTWPGHRAVLELWRYEPGRIHDPPVPPNRPNKTELYAEPRSTTSPAAMSEILAACAALAGEAGAEQIPLPCPSEVEVDTSKVDVVRRTFAFAWMRKRL